MPFRLRFLVKPSPVPRLDYMEFRGITQTMGIYIEKKVVNLMEADVYIALIMYLILG